MWMGKIYIIITSIFDLESIEWVDGFPPTCKLFLGGGGGGGKCWLKGPQYAYHTAAVLKSSLKSFESAKNRPN